MRIGLDARSIGQIVCGVSRVAFCLIGALSKIDDKNEYIVYTNSFTAKLILNTNFKIVRTYCQRKNPFKDMGLYRIIKKDKLDVYHSMHSWLPMFLPRNTKTILTVHDLFAITDPDFFIKYKPLDELARLYFKRLISMSIKKADIVVTVSDYCKKELGYHFPFAKHKIRVIYNAAGIDSSNINSMAKKLINEEYLLYVGNNRSYKNTDVLISGYYKFIKKEGETSRVKLVIAGNDSYHSIRKKIKELGIYEKVIFFATPSDEDMKNLYSYCLALIMPSQFEGFGIPVLEAMSFGVPVIVSNADALLEVSGKSALVFDKNDYEDLASAISRIVFDRQLRQKLVEAGFERIAEFSWESSARKLRDLYQSMLNKDKE